MSHFRFWPELGPVYQPHPANPDLAVLGWLAVNEDAAIPLSLIEFTDRGEGPTEVTLGSPTRSPERFFVGGSLGKELMLSPAS